MGQSKADRFNSSSGSAGEGGSTAILSIADAAPVDDADEPRLLPFATVAIAASAGGVSALRRLFAAMPDDLGAAFVVVMHLDPERESHLAKLLSRVTTMPVVQIEHDMPLEADHVYTGPPGHYVEVRDGRLLLAALPPRPAGGHVADRLMISLAEDQRERSAAIVLTGTDGDGAIGVKAIKGEGGLTIAQTPESAEHSGMPASAVATGMVDRQLPIEQMPNVLRAYLTAANLPMPAMAGSRQESERLLFDVLAQVRAARGLDFRNYKKPMLARRVRRRMGLLGLMSMSAYLELIRDKPEEVEALASDLLISVTEFFREPDAWVALSEEIVSRILVGKRAGEAVRVWVPGCATGQEAYSIGMVLLEHPRVSELGLRVQIFATDVDRRALEVARHGWYPDTIEQSVRSDRLRRFFHALDGGYKVRKELRATVLFAPQNVVSDPPFSRMDLVSCRNLLIYMTPELQRQVLQTFHFALEPDGYLFLGKSETVGSMSAQFAVASQRSRIYRRVGGGRSLPLPPQPEVTLQRKESAPPPAQPHPVVDHGRLLREALLEQRITAAVLVTPAGDSLYLYGEVSSYLDRFEGEPTAALFAMLRDELQPAVREAMREAASAHRRIECTSTMIRADGAEQPVRVAASPVWSGTEELLLLTFERLELAAAPPGAREREDTPPRVRALENELTGAKRELRAAIEELEATNEELKVANEEAMSVNEELQSSNEELETSKEELQSINEELGSINAELQEKVAELELANNDLGNLLSSTHIPTLFLDRGLRIKRFTPTATRLFRLIPSDAGRPLADIASRCDMRSLLQDAEQVLADLSPLQREIGTEDGEHYLRRTLPYRTHDDRIDGVVVTFTDITEIRRANEGRRQFAAVMQGSSDAMVVHDLEGRIQAWNRSAEAMYGYTQAEVLGKSMFSLLPEEARGEYREQLAAALAGHAAQRFETSRRTRQGEVIDVATTLWLVRSEDGTASAVALIERDVTQRKRADAELRASEQRFRLLADSAPVLIWTSDEEGRIEFANRECSRATGQPAEWLCGRRWTDLLHPDDVQRVTAALAASATDDGRHTAEGRAETSARLLSGKGDSRWAKIVVIPRGGAESGRVGCMIDIQSQVEAQESLRKADRRKDEFLAMLGHELRNPLAPIRNAAEVIKRIGGGDARLGWVRDTLVRQVEHVTRLVDDLLDISRITRGTLALRREPVELRCALGTAADAARPLLERKRHRFELHLSPEPVWVEGDPIRLVQVFENLLTNAAKYTDEVGEISVELSPEDGHAVINVRDNGLGIPLAMQDRVFELFVQDERSVDRSQGGLGIGLSLVKHLVHLHGGSVIARSRGNGQGSDFIVRLPLLPQPDVPRPAPEEPREAAGEARVLIVDDDPESTSTLSMVLGLGGFLVAGADDLDSALEAAVRLVPDVVVMDLAMPGADGYEVTRRLRALPELAHTRYVALSGFSRVEDRERTEREGFAAHFAKPADPAELERTLRRLLAQRDEGDGS